MSGQASNERPRPCRVLIVEDNEAAGRGLARILEVHGFEVTNVQDAASALRVLESENRPNVLLTDLQLPDMDGRELAACAWHLVPRPRIVLITGWDLDSAKEGPGHWGIDEVMVKPIDIPALLRLLAESSSGTGVVQAETEGNASLPINLDE
jgi:CheY-like chemotaxis protein